MSREAGGHAGPPLPAIRRYGDAALRCVLRATIHQPPTATPGYRTVT